MNDATRGCFVQTCLPKRYPSLLQAATNTTSSLPVCHIYRRRVICEWLAGEAEAKGAAAAGSLGAAAARDAALASDCLEVSQSITCCGSRALAVCECRKQLSAAQHTVWQAQKCGRVENDKDPRCPPHQAAAPRLHSFQMQPG